MSATAETVEQLKAMCEDLKTANAGVDRLVAQRDRMRDVLLLLDERGGLGHDMHDRIKVALGTPNGHFCSRARDCLKAGRCMRDPVCTN